MDAGWYYQCGVCVGNSDGDTKLCDDCVKKYFKATSTGSLRLSFYPRDSAGMKCRAAAKVLVPCKQIDINKVNVMILQSTGSYTKNLCLILRYGGMKFFSSFNGGKIVPNVITKVKHGKQLPAHSQLVPLSAFRRWLQC